MKRLAFALVRPHDLEHRIDSAYPHVRGIPRGRGRVGRVACVPRLDQHLHLAVIATWRAPVLGLISMYRAWCTVFAPVIAAVALVLAALLASGGGP